MTLDWRTLFAPNEFRLYELLLDRESDAWALYEIVVGEGVIDRPVDGEALVPVLAATESCLAFVSGELAQNPGIVPPACLRPGRYPWIRQRRDVHQFDVGSHLACCHALAVRGQPVVTADRAGAGDLAAALDVQLQHCHPSLMAAAGVFHDVFKCFRPRRPLPAKLGPKALVRWRTPQGGTPPVAQDADEVTVAVALLDDFFDDAELCAELRDCLLASKEISACVSDLRTLSPQAAAESAQLFWSGRTLDKPLATGLALYTADVFAKGFARYVPTARKGFTWSLHDACTLMLQAADTALAKAA